MLFLRLRVVVAEVGRETEQGLDVLKDPRWEMDAVPSVATQRENCSSNASLPNEESGCLMRELINTYGCYSLISLRFRMCTCVQAHARLCVCTYARV